MASDKQTRIIAALSALTEQEKDIEAKLRASEQTKLEKAKEYYKIKTQYEEMVRDASKDMDAIKQRRTVCISPFRLLLCSELI